MRTWALYNIDRLYTRTMLRYLVGGCAKQIFDTKHVSAFFFIFFIFVIFVIFFLFFILLFTSIYIFFSFLFLFFSGYRFTLAMDADRSHRFPSWRGRKGRKDWNLGRRVLQDSTARTCANNCF